MYIGHELLAFVVGSILARGLGVQQRRALAVGVVAGVFAFVPDLDGIRTVWYFVKAGPSDVFPTTQHIWNKSWVVHRSLTHSIVVGGVMVGAVGIFVSSVSRYRRDGFDIETLVGAVTVVGALIAVIGTAFSTDGDIGAFTVGVYACAVLLVGWGGLKYGFNSAEIVGAATVGILTHPFGDIFLGTPPVIIYPLKFEPSFDRVVFSSDPTINIVVLFLMEILLLWMAILTFCSLTNRYLKDYIKPYAVLGVVFASTIGIIQPPDHDVAYHFAIGTLLVGVVIGATQLRRPKSMETYLTVIATSLTGTSFAIIGYLSVYIALSYF